jgi:hypothetical protein
LQQLESFGRLPSARFEVVSRSSKKRHRRKSRERTVRRLRRTRIGEAGKWPTS